VLVAHKQFLKAQADGSLPPEVLQPPAAPTASAQVVDAAASDAAATTTAAAAAAAPANGVSEASSGADALRDAATSGEGQVPVSHGEHPEESDVAAAGPAAQTVQPVGCIPMPTISVVSSFVPFSFATLAPMFIFHIFILIVSDVCSFFVCMCACCCSILSVALLMEQCGFLNMFLGIPDRLLRTFTTRVSSRICGTYSGSRDLFS
jgi:hypothetical protein